MAAALQRLAGSSSAAAAASTVATVSKLPVQQQLVLLAVSKAVAAAQLEKKKKMAAAAAAADGGADSPSGGISRDVFAGGLGCAIRPGCPGYVQPYEALAPSAECSRGRTARGASSSPVSVGARGPVGKAGASPLSRAGSVGKAAISPGSAGRWQPSGGGESQGGLLGGGWQVTAAEVRVQYEALCKELLMRAVPQAEFLASARLLDASALLRVAGAKLGLRVAARDVTAALCNNVVYRKLFPTAVGA